VKDRLLVEAIGRARVLGCMADFSGELLTDGTVKFTRNVCLHLGGLEGSESGPARELCALLEAAGIRAALAPDVVRLEWSKFAGWIAQLPLAILTRRLTAEFLMDETAARVIVAGAREAKALADAEGIRLEDAAPLPVASITRSSDDKQSAWSRPWVDATGTRSRPPHVGPAGRRAQKPARALGYALERGAALGVPMPTLGTLYRTVRAAHPTL
jgi:ketopantoate reductase